MQHQQPTLTARLGRLAVAVAVAVAVASPLAACGKRGPNEAPEGSQYPRQYPSR